MEKKYLQTGFVESLHLLLRRGGEADMCLTNALFLSLFLLRAVMQPEIRRAVFRAHADGFLEGEVDAVAEGRKEGGVEGGRLRERGDGEGDVC
jgi:hypothetical protein